MSVIPEIADLSEFDPDSGPAVWFVWNEETGEGAGSDALAWEVAVAEVCGHFDRDHVYPMRWMYTGGDVFSEVIVDRVTTYRCGISVRLTSRAYAGWSS